MTHILDNRLAIDVDNDPATGWPNGLTKLRDIQLDGRPIEVAFFSPLLHSPKHLDQWKGFGRVAGLRFGPEWWGTPDPLVCAKIFSDAIGRFESDGKRRVDVAEYDIETHDLAWQLAFLLGTRDEDDSASWTKGIRGGGGMYPDPAKPQTLGYRWGRPFVYTFEGRQDQTTSAGDVAAKAGGKVGPQPYNGAMSEVWDDNREFITWVRSGLVPASRFTLYRDAAQAHRPRGMTEGILFATSRLTELYT